MANAIEWTFKMIDKMTPSTGKMSAGIGNVVDSLDHGLNVLGKFKQGVEMAGRGIAAALEPAIFKEATLIGFEALLGSAEKAREIFSEAVQFAAATPFETQKVIASYQQLLVAGFKQTEVPIVLKGIGDLAAIKGFDVQVIDRLILAMGQMKGAGKVMGGEMRQIMEAGAPMSAIYEAMADALGVTVEQVKKMQGQGKISADVGVFGILKGIEKVISGGKLGGMMDKTSRSLGGLISTLKSRPFEFLQDLADTTGFEVVKNVVSNLVNVLNPASEAGERLKSKLEEVGSAAMERLFGPFAGDEGATRIIGLVDEITDGLGKVETIAGAMGDGLEKGLRPLFQLNEIMSGVNVQVGTLESKAAGAGEALGTIVSGAVIGAKALIWIGEAFAWVGKVSSWVLDGINKHIEKKFIDPIIESLEMWGKIKNVVNEIVVFIKHTDIWGNLAKGFSAILPVFGKAGEDIGGAIEEGTKKKLKVQSPSQVFREIGMQSMAGFEQGINRPSTQSAINQAVTPSGGGFGGSPINIVNNIALASGSEQEAKMAGDIIGARIRSELMSLFEGMSLSTGRAAG